MLTRNQVIKAVKEKHPEHAEHLSLYHGKGYLYFVYDDGDIFEDHSVMVNKLNHMRLSGWVGEADTFLAKIKEIK